MKLVLSFIVFIFSLSVTDSQDEYLNPVLNFPSENIHRPGDGYPYPHKGYPNHEESVTLEDYFEFCDRMKEHFEYSNMTVEEADSFYVMLKTIFTLRDDSYGMPSKNAPSRKRPKLKERVMVKWVGPDTYDIFYYKIGCGRSLVHSQVYLDRYAEFCIRNIETWRESYPC